MLTKRFLIVENLDRVDCEVKGRQRSHRLLWQNAVGAGVCTVHHALRVVQDVRYM